MDKSSPLVISDFPPGERIMDVSENFSDRPKRALSNHAEAFSAEGISASEITRRRRNVMELDASMCATRLSDRQLLIRMQMDSSKDMMSDPVRFYRVSKKTMESGRVVDWD